MTFYSPAAFVFLWTIPAIVVLYLLKQRFQEHTVSSLYLWSQVLKDMEAHAPWQKLQRNILMILQIAAMLLLVFALANPFLNAAAGKPDTVVLAVDLSMSMQASDFKPSRFEAARKEAADFIANLQPGTKVTLISIGQTAVIEENLSSDKKRLMEKLLAMEVTSGTAGFEDAASLINSIAAQDLGAKVIVFGDKSFPIPGVDADFVSFAGETGNYAVMLLSHSRTKSGITALSRLANFSGQDAVIPVSLSADGRVLDAREVEIKSGETANVYWSGIPADIMCIECRIDMEDALDADNAAWNAVNPSDIMKTALVSEKNVFIEKVLSLTSGVEFFRINPGDADGLKGYNLYIYDGFMPDRLPEDGNILLVDPPENPVFEVQGGLENPVARKSSHELFGQIHDYSFIIGKSKRLTVPAWGKEVLGSDGGTLMFAGQMGKRRVFVVGFDLHDSDITLKPAFPILMMDALQWLLPSRSREIRSIYPGQEAVFTPDPKAEKVRVVSPSGKVFDIAPPFPVEAFRETGETGCYSLEQEWEGGKEYSYFAVNPPAELESNLMGVRAGGEPENTWSGDAQVQGEQTTEDRMQGGQDQGKQAWGDGAQGGQAPVTQAPGTQVPDAQASGARAPDAQGPGTQAPGTQAPVTQVPDAQGPGTQFPGTQAPGAQASHSPPGNNLFDGRAGTAKTGLRLQGILLWAVLILLIAEWWVYTSGA